MEEQKTNGQVLVGVNFNPSNLTEVDEVKQKFADLIDIVEAKQEDSAKHGTLTANRELLINYAKQQLIGAQMAVVKLLTFK